MEEWIYLIARIATCGVWVGAGVFKAAHIPQTIEEMKHNKVPLAAAALPFVLFLELAGSLAIIAGYYVSAVAAAWIVFTVLATPFYHCRWYCSEGKFIFPQMVQFTKNLSIIGGLLALILLDPNKPAWLVDFLKG